MASRRLAAFRDECRAAGRAQETDDLAAWEAENRKVVNWITAAESATHCLASEYTGRSGRHVGALPVSPGMCSASRRPSPPAFTAPICRVPEGREAGAGRASRVVDRPEGKLEHARAAGANDDEVEMGREDERDQLAKASVRGSERRCGGLCPS